MKKILLCLLLACSFIAKAQVYNNEWINFNNTYYKFKVGKTGLYRISQSALATAGLGSGWAEQFQLWRNGVQVPIYTSVVSGPLSATDYIEFWGEMNDGKPDKDLYRDPDYQLNDKWSLETDSATYFITITSAVSRRLEPTANNIAGNTLAAEPYFMHTVGAYFRDRINSGYAVNVDNQYLYSSSYDKGEGWSSGDIASNASSTLSFSNLQVYAGGPTAKFWIGVSGNAVSPRNYLVKINNDSIVGGSLDYYSYAKASSDFPVSLISSNNASVQVTNVCNQSPCPSSDRMVIHKYEITYPRTFDFAAAKNFEFSLPATTAGNYLEIKNFNFGTTAPVLYDLTNGKRYITDISVVPLVRVVLDPSGIERRLVLVNEEASNINTVSKFEQRIFKNYTLSSNQGDYLIISNSILFNGANGSNPVEDYRAYRASAAGGSYAAKIYLIDEIIDQFGFGIKKNPLGVRNFLRFARNIFSIKPKQVFLIGKGVEYTSQRYYENDPIIEKLNLVPTFGLPASDILLAADPGSSLPQVSIGRLSVVLPNEITDYLQKVKQAEQAQATLSPNIKDRAWMKNVLHLSGGGGEQTLATLLGSHMRDFKKIIMDTLFGANVYSLTKETSSTVEQIDNSLISKLYSDGLGMITYFGHSGATSLEFNVEDPSLYNNTGKYPLFVALGCNAGNIFNVNANRLILRNSTSENYVLIPSKGSIGFIASTHFGIVHYLGIWGNSFYNSLSNTDYGKTIGEIMESTAKSVFNFTTQEDFYSRANVEELNLMGDPAVRVYPHAKPDYVIEGPMVKVSPFVSVSDGFLKANVKMMNIGRAERKDIVLEIKHQAPNQIPITVYRDTIKGGILYSDSITLNIPIDPDKDKGANKLIFTIDSDNNVEELFETNNSVIKDYTVYEDEARPVSPHDFSIVNKQGIKFHASTSNSLMPNLSYRLEIDTTEFFDSPLKVSSTVASIGGILEFNPNVNFIDSTVYYWRVGAEQGSGDINWSKASFIYLPEHYGGFNQSHLYQHLKSDTSQIHLDSSSREWKFGYKPTNLFVRNGVWGSATTQEVDLTVSVNGNAYMRSACALSTLVFNIFNPITAKPEINGARKYGSDPGCAQSRQWNFQYSMMSASSRKAIMNFMDSIPDGYYVIVRSIVTSSQSSGFINQWKSDTALYGSNNSLYHKLKALGFDLLDGFTSPKAFTFVYRKGYYGFEPVSTISQGLFDKTTLSVDINTPTPNGVITSPILGPAKKWFEFEWKGSDIGPTISDRPAVNIIGIESNGAKTTLVRGLDISNQKVDVSTIDASTYPYVQLEMNNSDSTNFTPYQLKYWRLSYEPVPEGVIAPNIALNMKDTLELGEPLNFKVAFKNISDQPFDSLRVKLVITDRNNVSHLLSFIKHKPLGALDTLNFETNIDTKLFVGLNTLFVEMNPDNEQLEQFSFNNYLYKNFYVKGDTTNPFLDVTFDNRHILNNDIVSSKPEIIIKLKDDARWMLLDDTSLVNIKVRYPDGTIRTFSNFSNDTLSFNKLQQPSQLDNTATITFHPSFGQDGNYELIISGNDKSNNKAGLLEYRVSFQIINKPMISNLLNYPNPFTTSTAFVFTLTGSEVPQNLKIEILTVTGKLVREITKQELGSLQIGRNITEFKWNGTDQYGQKLANGVYLYRVVTNLNGKSLDKYKSETDNTGRYFNKGYGKMYLMR